jgi:hypothetical protein
MPRRMDAGPFAMPAHDGAARRRTAGAGTSIAALVSEVERRRRSEAEPVSERRSGPAETAADAPTGAPETLRKPPGRR